MQSNQTVMQGRESARLDSLRSYDVLDTPAEEVFDQFAQIAAALVGAPIALVSLVDGHRQWFKAKVGLAAEETSRDIAFCSHAIQSNDVFVVPDATADDRFASNPLVTGNPNIRFYAGAPLITSEGHALGTLCVIDTVPRQMTPEQQQSLLMLSRHVVAQLELRRRLNEFNARGVQRSQELTRLHRALDKDEFTLHYQPKVSLRTGGILGVEALIRWNDPERGQVLPGLFIPILEESGLILKVGSWVLRRAHDDYQDWVRQGLPAPRIAVNVSPMQVKDPQFVEEVKSILTAQHGIDIEITEGLLLEQTEESIGKLRAIQALGAKIAIDDFGTGYSSLRYLAQLPIDCLKIDRSFVHAMTSNACQSAIVSSVISLAHGLNMTVVAEGVETDEQKQTLRLMRCDEIQGYFHSRPMPKAALEALLKSQPAAVVESGGTNAEEDAISSSGIFFVERRRNRNKND